MLHLIIVVSASRTVPKTADAHDETQQAEHFSSLRTELNKFWENNNIGVLNNS